MCSRCSKGTATGTWPTSGAPRLGGRAHGVERAASSRPLYTFTQSAPPRATASHGRLRLGRAPARRARPASPADRRRGSARSGRSAGPPARRARSGPGATRARRSKIAGVAHARHAIGEEEEREELALADGRRGRVVDVEVDEPRQEVAPRVLRRRGRARRGRRVGVERGDAVAVHDEGDAASPRPARLDDDEPRERDAARRHRGRRRRKAPREEEQRRRQRQGEGGEPAQHAAPASLRSHAASEHSGAAGPDPATRADSRRRRLRGVAVHPPI